MIRGIEGKTVVCPGGERIDYGPFEEIQYRLSVSLWDQGYQMQGDVRARIRHTDLSK